MKIPTRGPRRITYGGSEIGRQRAMAAELGVPLRIYQHLESYQPVPTHRVVPFTGQPEPSPIVRDRIRR